MKDIKLSPERGVGLSGSCIFPALLITCFIVVSERFRMISSRMVRIHLVIGCFNVLCFGQDIPQGNYPRWSRSCQLSRWTETANFFPFAWLFASESPGSWSNDIRTVLNTRSDQNVSTSVRFVFYHSIGDLQIVITLIKGPQRLRPFFKQRREKLSNHGLLQVALICLRTVGLKKYSFTNIASRALCQRVYKWVRKKQYFKVYRAGNCKVCSEGEGCRFDGFIGNILCYFFFKNCFLLLFAFFFFFFCFSAKRYNELDF